MMRTRFLGVLTAIALASAGCSSSDDGTAPSIPTAPDATSAESTEPPATTGNTATPPDDTEPPETDPATTTDTIPTTATDTTIAPTTTTAPERVRRLPEELGPLVDADYDDLPDALREPGEFVEVFDNTLVYIPDSTDLDNLNNRRPVDDEEIAIIAAYAEANGALASQDTQNPVAIEPNERVQAAFLDGGQGYSENLFTRRNQEGTYVGNPWNRPDVYRPYVLTSPRTEDTAVVFDCKFTSTVLLFEDGTPAIDSSGPFNKSGSQATLVKVDDKWIVDEIILQEAACAE